MPFMPGMLRSVIKRLIFAPALNFCSAISALAAFSTVYPALLRMLEMLNRIVAESSTSMIVLILHFPPLVQGLMLSKTGCFVHP